jgi:hypothetical protein
LNLDFVLSGDDVARISSLGRPDSPQHGRLWAGDPATEER